MGESVKGQEDNHHITVSLFVFPTLKSDFPFLSLTLKKKMRGTNRDEGALRQDYLVLNWNRQILFLFT